MNRRMKNHPVIDVHNTIPDSVTITVDGQPILAIPGEPIAAALYANGLRVLRRTPKLNQSRGVFCGIGQCTDCAMIVDGIPNTRTCITPVEPGMAIETQLGLGRWGGGV